MLFTIFLGLVSIFATTDAYAQTLGNSSISPTSPGTNTTSMIGMAGNNTSSAISDADNFTSSVSIFQPMINGFKSSIQVTLNDAISTAEQSLGNNATTLAAFIHPENEFIVYNVFGLDSNNIAHKVTVDPGNGNILSSEQMSFMEMMMMLHDGSDMMGPQQGMGMKDYEQGMGMKDYEQGMGMKDYEQGMGMKDYEQGMGMKDYEQGMGMKDYEQGMGMKDHSMMGPHSMGKDKSWP